MPRAPEAKVFSSAARRGDDEYLFLLSVKVRAPEVFTDELFAVESEHAVKRKIYFWRRTHRVIESRLICNLFTARTSFPNFCFGLN